MLHYDSSWNNIYRTLQSLPLDAKSFNVDPVTTIPGSIRILHRLLISNLRRQSTGIDGAGGAAELRRCGNRRRQSQLVIFCKSKRHPPPLALAVPDICGGCASACRVRRCTGRTAQSGAAISGGVAQRAANAAGCAAPAAAQLHSDGSPGRPEAAAERARANGAAGRAARARRANRGVGAAVRAAVAGK